MDMQAIVEKQNTSSRVRFMLLDVIDLRRMKWVPRREDANPKTIDQIHKDAEAEEAKRNVQIQEAKQREREKQQQPNQQRGRGERGTGKFSSHSLSGSFGCDAPSALFRSPSSSGSSSRRSGGRKRRSATNFYY